MPILTAAPAPMTRIVREEIEDNRWYLIGDQRLMSASTATGNIEKAGLVPWAASVTADAAFVELPTVLVASRVKPCGNTWSRCRGDGGHDPAQRCDSCPCGECKACVARWLARRHAEHAARRADEGTRVHDVIEWWSYTGEFKAYDPDIAPYIAAFKALVAEYGLTPDSWLMAEAIVINRTAGYAGTTDGVIRIEAAASMAAAKLVSRLTQMPWRQAQRLRITVDLVVDFKTREGEGPEFYPPQALQITGYRHAETVLIRNTDIEQPMPETDGGMLIQLRPDGATPRLVLCDEDTYQHGFLPTLASAKWVIERGAAAVSSRTFVLPETQRARDRKAAKEAAVAAGAAGQTAGQSDTSETREVA